MFTPSSQQWWSWWMTWHLQNISYVLIGNFNSTIMRCNITTLLKKKFNVATCTNILHLQEMGHPCYHCMFDDLVISNKQHLTSYMIVTWAPYVMQTWLTWMSMCKKGQKTTWMPLSCFWTLLCNKAKRWKGWSFKS